MRVSFLGPTEGRIVCVASTQYHVCVLQALDEFATKLIENEHYAADDVANRRDAVRSSFKCYFASRRDAMDECIEYLLCMWQVVGFEF